MKKDRPPLKKTTVPDVLTTFARKIRPDDNKQSAKEILMSQLSPPRCQIDFLPATVNLGKCDALDHEETKEFRDTCDADKDDLALRSSPPEGESKGEEDAVTDEGKEAKCLGCLTDDLELSYDGEWLRNYLKIPLRMAMTEIVAKKPDDPINYLGFWLLYYRKHIEKNQWQLEADRELKYYRSLVREPELEELVSEKGEDEELARDWNFKYYESTHKPA
ncbi:uncharacterized protein LOC117226070 [Megalopta genalis]|uniref:uncharacterized protein LOC117226070 n=1 Tax=Megalopta genalis TaxID=115081 RepID=UPI003FCF3CAB